MQVFPTTTLRSQRSDAAAQRRSVNAGISHNDTKITAKRRSGAAAKR